MRILDKILKLPRWEERKFSQGWVARTFLPPRFTRRSDDTYILYQCARACFYLTGVLLLLNWVSLLFQININLYFFEIDLPKEDFIRTFSKSFSLYISTIILTTIVPFYFIKYFYNVNPKKVDITWWYTQIQPKTKSVRFKSILWFLWGISIFVMLYFAAQYSPLFLMNYSLLGDLSSSKIYFAFVSLIYFVVYSGAPFYIIFFFTCLYRYIGPYQGELSSNSIRNGEQQ